MMRKRIFSMILCVAMLFTSIVNPLSVQAEDSTSTITNKAGESFTFDTIYTDGTQKTLAKYNADAPTENVTTGTATYSIDVAVGSKNYMLINLTTDVNLVGYIYYTKTNDATTSRQEKFYIEAGTEEFTTFLDAYRNGALGAYEKTITKITLQNVDDTKVGTVILNSVGFCDRSYDPNAEMRITGNTLRVGTSLGDGGAITYLSRIDAGNETIEYHNGYNSNVQIKPNNVAEEGTARFDESNLINVYDLGREVQQSFYWPVTADNGYAPNGDNTYNEDTHYNPIQCGSNTGKQPQVVDYYYSDTEIYVKIYGQDWYLDNQVDDTYYETWLSFDKNGALIVKNKVTNFTQFTGTDSLEYVAQETPALYTVYPLNYFYAETKEGTIYDQNLSSTATENAAKTSLNDTVDGDYYYNLDSEQVMTDWVAFVTEGKYGLGIYNPSADYYRASRGSKSIKYSDNRTVNNNFYEGEVSDWKQSCYTYNYSYLNTTINCKMTDFVPLEYSYAIYAGYVGEIRAAFNNLRTSGDLEPDEILWDRQSPEVSDTTAATAVVYEEYTTTAEGVYNLSDYVKYSTYPDKYGYVFGGWYREANNENASLNKTALATATSAYAKFVPKDVLKVKAQISANTTADSTETKLRLISSVDSLKYNEAGFDIWLMGEKATISIKDVYKTITGYKNNQNISYTPKGEFNEVSKYFVTNVISKIPNKLFGEEFTVTPYWITKDGTKVSGTTRTFKIDDAFAADGLVDFYVEVPEDRDPIVLQLTDPQIIDASQARSEDRLEDAFDEYWAQDKAEERCYNYITETIQGVKDQNDGQLDLILITGDIIFGEFDDNGTAWVSFIEFMDSFKIPWAPIFGNHENESIKGVDWQCEQLENSEYCLFKQRELTGNGNYTVGIKQGGKLQRVFFMLDSNGCTNASAESLANDHTITATGFGDDQIEWYTETAQQIKANWPDTKLSFAFHIQIQAFIDASEKYTAPVYIDTLTDKGEGDFGYLPGTEITGWDTDYRVWNGLKELGVDSIFIGHMHTVSASILYEGVRLQYGQKSSTYDAMNFVEWDGTIVQTTGGDMNEGTKPLVGGTVLPLSKDDGAIVEPYIYLCDIDWDSYDKVIIPASKLTNDANYGAVTFTTGTDEAYGDYSELADQQTSWVNVYYDSAIKLTGRNKDLVVYIYNPLSSDVDVAFGNISGSQGNGIFGAPDSCYARATLKAKAWTKVVIEWSEQYTNQIALKEVRMVVVASEESAAGNFDADLTGFKMSSMYIVDNAEDLEDPAGNIVEELINAIDNMTLATVANEYEDLLAQYNALSEADKALVTNADKLTAFENMTVISAELLTKGMNGDVTSVSDTDATYGKYGLLTHTSDWATVCYDSEMLLTGLQKDLVVYIYNPTDSDVDVAFVQNNWGEYGVGVAPTAAYASTTLKAQEWTKVVIDWSNYGHQIWVKEMVMVVVASESSVAGNYTNLTGFKMSSMYIVDDAAALDTLIPESGEVDKVQEVITGIDELSFTNVESVLAKYNELSDTEKEQVTNADKLTAFENMTVISAETLTNGDYGTVTSTIGTDATYGTYGELTHTGDWATVRYNSNMLLTGLQKDLAVYIYNPTDSDVKVAFVNNGWDSNNHGLNCAPDNAYARATLTAKAWTKVVIDWSQYSDQLYVKEVYMAVVASETSVAGSSTNLTGFKMSSMYIVDDAAALDTLIPKSEEVEAVIAAIDELSFANVESVLAQYNALSDEDKAQVTNADKLTAFENMTVISAETLINGDYGTVTSTIGTDATYGTYGELNHTADWATVRYNSNMLLTGLQKDLVVYIYNPTDSDVNVAFVNNTWGDHGLSCAPDNAYARATLTAKAWTKVVIDWSQYGEQFYVKEIYMAVIASETSVAGNYTNLTGFKMSSMYIVDDATSLDVLVQ